MQLITLFTALFYVGLAEKDVTNPLSKVIDLLKDLSAKVTADGEAEAKAYKEYFEWCDDAAANSKYAIETASKSKAKLEAKIAQLGADIDTGVAKIEDLASAIATNEADLKSATAIREKEAADFAKAESELVDTVDTLSRAIAILEREMAKNPAAFAQMDTSSIDKMVSSFSAIIDAASFSNADRNKLTALIQSRSSDDQEPGAPAAATYKTHSTNIVDVLEDLKESAEAELADLRKAESSAKHNFNMLKQSLEDQMAADNKDLSEEKADKAAAAEGKAGAEGDLEVTTKQLEDSKKALETASSTCMQVAADHQATVAAREEELKVLAKAIELLKSTTTGAVDETYSFLQRSQIHSSGDLAQTEAIALVRKLSREHHSAALSQLASRLSAVVRYGAANGDDIFAKVKGLISDLISRLEKEADADATEKAWCDEQMAKTELKKNELDAEIAKLTSKIDQAAAKSAGLKEEVKDLQAQLAALAKEQASMDSIRQEENAAFIKAKADLELGLEGVRSALVMLKQYYGASAALVQQPAKPEIFKKSTGAGSSIIGTLEVIESDFATALAKEETAESDAVTQYEKMTQENAIEKTLKEQDVKYKTQEFTSLDKELSELSSDRESASTELSAVLEYYSKVKDRCIAKPETYEERKKRREAEIAGLKEALSILESETASFVQRRKHGNVRGVIAA
jgi:chromosome segregation ATPase